MLSTDESKGDDFMADNTSVPVWQKFALTISEATAYFNIGEKKLRKLIEDYIDSGFVLQNGAKSLIKRQQFEEFLNKTNAI